MTAFLKTIGFTVPQDCPAPAVFKRVVAKTFRQSFDSDEQAAQCRLAYLNTLIVPEPFASNEDAARDYQSALYALDPKAQAWGAFEEAVNREFADIEEDGDTKTPAIPGWQPGWIRFTP